MPGIGYPVEHVERHQIGLAATHQLAPLDGACNELEALFVLPSFDPANAERTFVIATPDQATFHLAPRWLDVIRTVAPGVRLRFIGLSDTIDAT